MAAVNIDPTTPVPRPIDPVVEAYKKDVDRTLLRENLKLTVDERFQRFERFMRRIADLPEGVPKPTNYERVDLLDDVA